jgi:hypothetical protein
VAKLSTVVELDRYRASTTALRRYGKSAEREWCGDCGQVRRLGELRPRGGLLLCRACRLRAMATAGGPR